MGLLSLRKTPSSHLEQRYSRKRVFRLILLLGGSLLVSFGLIKILTFSAYQSLPRFESAPPPPPASVALLPDPGVLFHENFESFEAGIWRHFVRNKETDYRLSSEEGEASLKAIAFTGGGRVKRINADGSVVKRA